MPAFPERFTRRHRTDRDPIERYRDPDVYPTAIRGALIGLAVGTVMWLVAVESIVLIYRWWVG